MLATEIHSSRYYGLDTWANHEILNALLEGQLNALAAVRSALPALQGAAAAMMKQLQNETSRLVYVGAGASGHLALQDGMEMPQTFGWPGQRLLLLMAGGDAARLAADGIQEDSADSGIRDISNIMRLLNMTLSLR